MSNRLKKPRPKLTAEKPSRRRFLSALAFAAAAGGVGESVVGSLATPYIGRLFGLPDFSPNQSAAPDVARERLDLLFRLFLSSEVAESHFMAPDDWVGGRPDVAFGNIRTYGHEAEVLQSISDLFYGGHLATWETTDSFMEPNAKSSRVMIGSGASNRATEPVIGTPSMPNFRVAGVGLRYGIKKADGASRRIQYGKEIERDLHAICDDHLKILWQPEVRGGWQMDDYLLVTRVPIVEKGASLSVFAGLHGPGTRGTELLWSLPLEALRELDSRVSFGRKVPYYQAVFHASGLREQGETRSSHTERHSILSQAPTALKLVIDRCPPLPL